MSTVAPNTTSTPPRHRAFELHCQGLHAPAIAAQLGILQRTVRYWIATTLARHAEAAEGQAEEQLALAIARQEAILAAVWQGFARAAECESLVLQQTQRQQRGVDIAAELLASARAAAAEGIPMTGPSGKPDDNPFADTVETRIAERLVRAVPEPPRLPMVGSRYLAMAHAAQKEITRLQSLYRYEPPRPVEEVPVMRITSQYDEPTTLPPEDLAAWRIFRTQYLAVRHPSSAGADRDEFVRSRQRHFERLQREHDRKETTAQLRRRAERERRLARALALLDDDPAEPAESRISAISAISANPAGIDSRSAPAVDMDQSCDDIREPDGEDDDSGNDTSTRDEAPTQPEPKSDPRYLIRLKLADAVNADNDTLLQSLLARLDAGTLPPPDLSPPATNVFVTPAPAEPPAQASASSSLAQSGPWESPGHDGEGTAGAGDADHS